ncbi:hypothetical protein [Hydrogenophaga sp.]
MTFTKPEGVASSRLEFVTFGTEPRPILVDGHLHGKVHMHLTLG